MGFQGVWNIITRIATAPERQEILDWYHLLENLHKNGGSIKRLNQAERFVWKGKVDEAIALFNDSAKKQAKNFCEYLRKHRHRIVNYDYFQRCCDSARLVLVRLSLPSNRLIVAFKYLEHSGMPRMFRKCWRTDALISMG